MKMAFSVMPVQKESQSEEYFPILIWAIWEARSFSNYSEHVGSNTINKEHERSVSLVTIGTVTILNAVAIPFFSQFISKHFIQNYINFFPVTLFMRNLIKVHKTTGTSGIWFLFWLFLGQENPGFYN